MSETDGAQRTDELTEVPEMDYATVTSNRDAAAMFAHYLLETARAVVPEREWSLGDLAAVLRFALEGGEPPVSFLDGRLFDRRLAEALERAERYGETFSVMVVGLGRRELGSDLYASVLDGLVERLRRSDQVFLFRGRAAIILPYTAGKDLTNLTRRIEELVCAVLGRELEMRIDNAAYPTDISTPDALRIWVGERLEG